MAPSRMFTSISDTWNPVGGKCGFGCVYCWSMAEGGLVDRFHMEKYRGAPRLVEREMKSTFRDGAFVFVQDMSDLFSPTVPTEIILRVLHRIAQFPKARFLLLTKNPRRYLGLLKEIPQNCTLGATVESNRNYPEISHAPLQSDRLDALAAVIRASNHLSFLSMEPVMDFDLVFSDILLDMGVHAVAVGYDNYGHHLKEPNLDKVRSLIADLQSSTVVVYTKTMRPSWTEEKYVTFNKL